MKAETIVQRANELGIALTLNGDRIRYAPKSLAPDDLVEALRENKTEILCYLRQQANVQSESDLLNWASDVAERNLTST